MKYGSIATVTQLQDFDEFIDVRSPSEFAEDHIPEAVNCPVLDDEERARVGTIYKQVSTFEAKKVGAALVSRNIARHIESQFHNKPRTWQPLVYCWRGGTRSGAMTHILQQVGWRATQLDGGYQAYRRFVVAELQSLARTFTFHVLCGPTGSGKSRVLQELTARGAQVLNLEDLAAHRGSVLGNLPEKPQPSQKFFESLIWRTLALYSPARPVFVEAESKKIGNLQVPDALISRMWQSACIVIEAPLTARVGFLKREYGHFLSAAPALHEKLDCLASRHGGEKITRWKSLSNQGRWDELVSALLVDHYDPAYSRSTLRNYPRISQARRISTDTLGPHRIRQLASLILDVT